MKKFVSLFLVLALFILPGTSALAASSGSSNTLTLDHSNATVRIGESTYLTASFNGSPTTAVSWSSANPNIASVNGGVVSGVSLGSTQVTATNSLGQTATCYIHVAYKGIDVSAWQGNIDWPTAKASGIDFAIIRTGYGKTAPEQQTDKYFATNYTGATQNGLKVGVYHYSYAENTADAAQEAQLCLSILNGRSLDYPVFYDIEEQVHRTMDKEKLADIVETFCSAIQAAGYKVGVYSSPNIFNSNLSSSRLDKYDRWVASWGRDTPNYSKSYTIWQYAYGTLPGISGNVDLNYSFVDYSTSSNPTPVTPTYTLSSDTNAPYTFGTNKTYFYKVTTNSASAPTAVSSNPSAVSVSYGKAVSGGHIFQINNVGPGTAMITTSIAEGPSVSFMATGTDQTPPAATLSSDTTHPYTFGTNKAYYYKITTNSSNTPTAVSSNPAAVSVQFGKKTSDGYIFQINNIGAGTATITTSITEGASISFEATGNNQSSPSVPVTNKLTCDTTHPFTMQVGKLYTFLFKPAAGVGTPSFNTGNGSIVTTAGLKYRDGNYLVTVKALKSGSTGMYATLPGQPSVQYCIINVA